MTITALVNVPSINDPTNFEAYADNLLSVQFPTLITEINTATNAMNLNATQDTSATSNSIGTGSKTFTVSAGKSFLGGQFLIIADTAAPSTNAMYCQVTSYSGTSLVVNVISVQGSGTKTAWLISQSGYQFNLGAAMAFNGSITAPGFYSSSTSAKHGYITGAGGTVTQATSKTTAVTLNRPCGIITMNAAALGANATVSFTFNNTVFTSATDYLLLTVTGGGSGANATAYNANFSNMASGSCTINVRNLHLASLSDAVELSFMVFNSATA